MNAQKRHLDTILADHFNKYKQVLLLLGARQVGKTTILKKLFPSAQYFLLDNEPVLRVFETYDINVYNQSIKASSKIIILDEIHLLKDPGRCAKILYDLRPDLKIIITGSSSLHIKNKTGESLAGRHIKYNIYPLTFSEYLVQKSIVEKLDNNILNNLFKDNSEATYLFNLEETLKTVLLYGLYPHIIGNPKDNLYLKYLVESAIFKDIVDLSLIENKKDALNLLKLLAYQIGNIVNYSEIASRLSIDSRTVQRYIQIFEESFILFRLYPYSKGKRREITKSPKIYFYDTGIRNALISNFDDLAVREDRGALFENFIISEVYKINNYFNLDYRINYWRTSQDFEVDLVISNNKTLLACEIKYGTGNVSGAFINRYPQAVSKVITSKNFY